MSLSLQYCKLHRKENESMKEWMDRFCIKPAECYQKEYKRWFKEQFMKGIDDEQVMEEIIKELTAWKKHVRNTINTYWCRAQRVEVQRVQKRMLDKMKNIKDFDHVHKYKHSQTADRQHPRKQKTDKNRKLLIPWCSTYTGTVPSIW